jgi:hypothetical protein
LPGGADAGGWANSGQEIRMVKISPRMLGCS